MPTLVLASQSPRRQQLLTAAGVSYTLLTCETDEHYPAELPSTEVALYIAHQKAKAVEQKYGSSLSPNTWILSADTIVVLDEAIFGKPTDAHHAKMMLQQLSNRTHKVITGVCLLSVYGYCHQFAETTTVVFRTLSDEQIDYYIDNYRPFDKAGSYAIQEWIGMVGIARIEGCYFNIVGLPINKVYHVLKELQFELP